MIIYVLSRLIYFMAWIQGFNTILRFFNDGRGKAMSIASPGHPIGEMILSTLLVSAIHTFGWSVSVLLSVAFIL